MGTALIQGELWGRVPRDWSTIQEPTNKPLWKVMLDKALVNENLRWLADKGYQDV